jgi:hypothetical protein
MTPNDDPIPLLPPMTEEEIEAFYRRERKRPLTPEELAFFRNPVDTVPMDEVIADLEAIIKKRQEEGTLP